MRRGQDARSQEAVRLDSPRIQPETRTACVPLKVANTRRSLERYRDGARPHAMPWREEYADSLSASGYSHHIAGPNKRPGCDLPLALSALYPERIYLRGPGGSDVELYGDRLMRGLVRRWRSQPCYGDAAIRRARSPYRPGRS